MTNEQYSDLKTRLQDIELLMLFVQSEVRVLQYQAQAQMVNQGVPLSAVLEHKKKAVAMALEEVAKQWPELRSTLRSTISGSEPGGDPPTLPPSR